MLLLSAVTAGTNKGPKNTLLFTYYYIKTAVECLMQTHLQSFFTSLKFIANWQFAQVLFKNEKFPTS